ncbi:MAG: hypothetical protein JSR66_01295 [Proteobacteria bacterium]|nr:hypothetical protein [Pseudomonadota bacterium]
MLFSVAPDGSSLSRHRSNWSPKELELEKYLISGPGAESGILNASIFGEELLVVKNQVSTQDKKRADIVALDQQGSSVFIELKRDQAPAGASTQALQYLAAFTPFRGRDFARQFRRNPKQLQELEERIKSFLGSVSYEDVNRRQRIILMARSFDRALFSMGKWFGSNGIAFRCMDYAPMEVNSQRFLSFSVVFDQSPPDIFPLTFSGSLGREPAVFWHNIGAADDDWWTYLRDQGEIPTSWDNVPDDEGEALLKSYMRGDRIVAYAKGFGALGWGVLEDPVYRLVPQGAPDDRRSGVLRHRLTIKWKATARHLQDAIPPAQLRAELDLYHPVSTSVTIADEKAQRLLAMLDSRFAP